MAPPAVGNSTGSGAEYHSSPNGSARGGTTTTGSAAVEPSTSTATTCASFVGEAAMNRIVEPLAVSPSITVNGTSSGAIVPSGRRTARWSSPSST